MTTADNHTAISKKHLQAGAMAMSYDQGSLRYIRIEGEELLRRVYVSLRDESWGTFTPVRLNEGICSDKGCFLISYDCYYRIKNLPVFKWKVQIEGQTSNEIRLTAHGMALSSFKKNRAGLCILHPIKTCAGQNCTVTTKEGKRSEHTFPTTISPDQPFKNMQKLEWLTPGKIICELQLEGDVFETEDQRNWTDASFKTYCTPLHLPYPVTLREGDTIHQTMTFRAHVKNDIHYISKVKEQRNLLKPEFERQLSWPDLGTCLAIHQENNIANDAALLRKLSLDHYRVDLRLRDPQWLDRLKHLINHGNSLPSRLELALHLSDDKNELQRFIALVPKFAHSIRKIILLGPSKITSNSIVEKYILLLKQNTAGIPVGGGTDCYFAELNRSRINAERLDFISFSVNPQVHAFDDLTLIENMEAQHDVVASTRKLYPHLPVHVSPVTLTPRFNPDTRDKFVSGDMPSNQTTDPRQKTTFAAGWTLGSFKYLATAGAASITYYETKGANGLIPGLAPTENYDTDKIYPVYLLLYLLTEFKNGKLFAGKSNDPLQYNGLFLIKGKRKRCIVANHLPNALNIKIANLTEKSYLKTLDGHNQDYLLSNPDLFLRSKGRAIRFDTIRLEPYGIGIVDNYT